MRTLSGLNTDLLAQLVQKWLEWKMSEVDDIVQVQSKKNHSQEWVRQRKIFLEEKNGLSLLTGKRKPQVPQVELREEVPIGHIIMLDVTVDEPDETSKGMGVAKAEGQTTDIFRVWDEAHILRLSVCKGKADRISKVILKAKDRWRHHFKINRAAEIQEQQSYWEAWAKNTGNTVSSRAGEEEVWRTYGYDGGLGGHGSEGFRVEGERRWISSASIGRERLREWAALLQETASNELEELGKLCWSTTGLEEPPTTSTMRAQLTVTSDLDKVSDILEAETTTVGLLERRLVWSEGPWRADNMLRAWEGVLEGKAFAKRPKCGNDDECCGHPVPIARMVEGKRVIDSFCQTCWTWSDFRKNKSVPLPMTFLEKWGVFNTRLARPDKGRLRGKLTDEEFENGTPNYPALDQYGIDLRVAGTPVVFTRGAWSSSATA